MKPWNGRARGRQLTPAKSPPASCTFDEGRLVNPTANPPVDMKMLEETRRHINRLIEEVGRLAESELPPTEFYGEMLKRVLSAMAAPAGAVWTRTTQGNLQLSFQINMREVGLDRNEGAKLAHED